ncbi:hypothetical protein THAOC_00262, partial [Thalassiosira oceanica]
KCSRFNFLCSRPPTLRRQQQQQQQHERINAGPEVSTFPDAGPEVSTFPDAGPESETNSGSQSYIADQMPYFSRRPNWASVPFSYNLAISPS